MLVCVCCVAGNSWNISTLKKKNLTIHNNHKDDKEQSTLDSHRKSIGLSTNHLIMADEHLIMTAEHLIMTAEHQTTANDGTKRSRFKRMAQPRIIRVRAHSMPSDRSSSSLFSSAVADTSFGLPSYAFGYGSATLHKASPSSASASSAIETTTRKRKVKGFRFDAASIPGSKIIHLINLRTSDKRTFFYFIARSHTYFFLPLAQCIK